MLLIPFFFTAVDCFQIAALFIILQHSWQILEQIDTRPAIELCGAVFNVCTSVLLCGYTVVKDNISTRSHSLIQLGQFLQAGH
jgi:hypothetical protein